MTVLDLEETPDVFTVDIVPYSVNGPFSGEMSTIYVQRNGEQISWWPKLGPWERSETHAARFVGL